MMRKDGSSKLRAFSSAGGPSDVNALRFAMVVRYSLHYIKELSHVRLMNRAHNNSSKIINLRLSLHPLSFSKSIPLFPNPEI